MGRRLGQHFLASKPILEKIALATCPLRESLVIEIGPGRGALTEYLIERTDRLIAIELDPPLVEHIRARFPEAEVVHSDVLEVDLAQWGRCVIAGNLPYYITSPIVERIVALGPLCQHAILMVQKEVAERLAASPGNRDYGYLSVATQSQAEVKYLFTVPRGAFQPPPKVESAVVRLTPRSTSLPAGFLRFAGLCFRQKRKTLRNNLQALYPKITEHPEAGLRAEQLSVEQLKDLHSRLVS